MASGTGPEPRRAGGLGRPASIWPLIRPVWLTGSARPGPGSRRPGTGLGKRLPQARVRDLLARYLSALTALRKAGRARIATVIKARLPGWPLSPMPCWRAAGAQRVTVAAEAATGRVIAGLAAELDRVYDRRDALAGEIEVWVAGAEKWRNPDLDLPADLEANRAENYAQLRKPLDPRRFTGELREELDAEMSALDAVLGGKGLAASPQPPGW
jgi:hypothetical protein